MKKFGKKGILKNPMKFLFVSGIFLMSIFTSFPASALGQKASVNLENVSLKEVFREIKHQTGYTFVFNEAAVQKAGKVSVNVSSEDMQQLMDECLKGTSLEYYIENKVIVILSRQERALEAAPQAVQIKGVVVDPQGNPLPGVTIMLKGTTLGCATDVNGEFALEVGNAENVTLEFSFVGMKKKVVDIKHPAQQSGLLRVEMEEEVVSVDEVVVVGYGVATKRDLTGQVSSVGEKEIEKKNVMNVENLLQNMAAGVVVSQASSNPSEKIRVRVRGEASLTGDNEPLFVVDGIPVESDVINTIAPQDIQSMDVLKDASAAAIYGSRGANGVIIITTKRGKQGSAPRLNASYTFSTDSRIQNYHVLNGDEFREFVRYTAEQTLKVDPSNDAATSILAEGSDELMNGNTDWYKELRRPAFRHDVNLSLRGGGERSNYFISFGVMDYQGMLDHDDYTRYNGRINLDYDVTDFLRFGTSTTLGYTDISNAQTSMYTAIGFRPVYPVYNEDGTYFRNGTTNNPVASNEARSYSDNFSILSASYLELKIWKGLKLKTSLALNQNMSFSEYFSPSFLYSDGKATGGESTSRSFSTVWDNTLAYNNTFNDIHALDAVVGVSFERTKNRGFGIDVKNYPMDQILTGLTNASEYVRKNGSGQVYGLQSTFARFNYRLMDKYLFTFTARYDGSSSFGSNNRYGFFPSGAIAWRISEEKFLKSAEFINDLKIKASAGRTGVQNFNRGSYANKDLYSTSDYMNNPAIVHSQMGNRDIKWETTVQYDLGIDFTLFNYVLSGNIAYYRKNTDDLIWQYTPPSSLAVSSVPTNIGAVRNQGIEVTLRANIFQHKKDWKWELALNASHNRNKVTRLVEEGAQANGMGITVQGSGSQVLAEGHPMGSFFGYAYDGIIQNEATIKELNDKAKEAGKSSYNGTLRPGHLLIRDVDGSGYIDNNDRVIIGSPQADLIGGLTSNLSYKRLSLYTLWGFQIGGKKLYNKTLQNLPNQLTGLIDYNLYNRWNMDNQDAKLPAMYIGDGVTSTTSLELHNASNLRLQELRLSYELPTLFGGKYLKSGEVFFNATNLFVITKYPGLDPSTIGYAGSNYGSNYEGWSYPAIRTFSFGLKLNF